MPTYDRYAAIDERFKFPPEVGKANAVFYTTLSPKTDLNTIREPGKYLIATNADAGTMINSPSTRMGVLEVDSAEGANPNIVSQTYKELHRPSSNPNTYYRCISSVTETPYSFTSWMNLTGTQLSRLPANTDINTVRDTGKYLVGSDADAKSMPNMPSERMGILEVDSATGVNSNIVSQTYRELYESSSKPNYFYRCTSGLSPSPYPFTPWANLAVGTPLSPGIEIVDDSLLKHEMLKQEFRESRGGTIGTNGAAFAWRFDHGLNKFPGIVELLRKYQFPASQAYFYHQFDSEGAEYVFNNQRTWADCISWAMNDGVEPVNHSATHKPAENDARLAYEIAQSKADIQRVMPRSLISGWITPGGLSTFPSSINWATTYEGKLIVANHAWAEGYTPGELHALDGNIHIGQHSWTIDNMSAADRAEELIDLAIEQGSGLNFMVHPNNVGLLNRITLTRLEEIMSYIASKRDSGELAVLTLGGLQIADARSSYRINLLRDPKLRSGLSKWTATTEHSAGVTSGEPVINFSSSAGVVSQTIELASIAQVKGGIYELFYEVQAPTGAVVAANVSDNSNTNILNATREITIDASSDWVPVRKHFTIPRINTTELKVELGRVSGGSVSVRRMAIQAV